MTTRIVGLDEWQERNAGLGDDHQAMQFVEPQNVGIVAIEDDDGRVLAHLGVYRISWLEGLWISPEAAHNLGVTRALLEQTMAIPRVRGERWALACSNVPKVQKFLGRLGREIPTRLFAIPAVPGGGS